MRFLASIARELGRLALNVVVLALVVCVGIFYLEAWLIARAWAIAVHLPPVVVDATASALLVAFLLRAWGRR